MKTLGHIGFVFAAVALLASTVEACHTISILNNTSPAVPLWSTFTLQVEEWDDPLPPPPAGERTYAIYAKCENNCDFASLTHKWEAYAWQGAYFTTGTCSSFSTWYSTSGTKTIRLEEECPGGGQEAADITVRVVSVQKIQYNDPSTGWTDVYGTLYVHVGTTVEFRAIPTPAGAWPNGKPVWGGTSGASGSGATTSVTFNTLSSSPSDYKTVSAECGLTRIVNVVVVEVDLEVSGVSEWGEGWPGGVIVRNHGGNDPARTKIEIRQVKPTTWTGNVLLTRNNSKIKVYDALTGGTEITFNGTDNKFANSSLATAKELFVEGVDSSDSSRDTHLKLALETYSDVCDIVNLTVLWVDISGKYYLSDTLSIHNDKRDQIRTARLPIDFKLGQHWHVLFDQYISSVLSVEFEGQVNPSDFNPSLFAPAVLRFSRRDLGEHWYWGPNGYENHIPFEADDDNSHESWRDDDPSDGDGKIYDYDSPGLNVFPTVQAYAHGTVFRRRLNYEQYAEWGNMRCSEIHKWKAAQSWKLTGVIDIGTATSVGTRTLTNSSATWASDTWKYIWIVSGAPPHKLRPIESNTSDTITIYGSWGADPPAAGSDYILIGDKDVWEVWAGVTGDNVAADGHLDYLTWNLEE